MAKIAILGFGTVGSGVYEVLCRNAAGVSRRAGEPVEVKYILDPKDFSGHPAANLFVKNFDVILEDPEIRVVVETIGGTRFAYPYVKACLESRRSVRPSPKELVATSGAGLQGRAQEQRRAGSGRKAGLCEQADLIDEARQGRQRGCRCGAVSGAQGKPAGQRGRCVQCSAGQGRYAGRRGVLRQGRRQAAHRQRRGGRRCGCPEAWLQGARQPVLAAC